MNFPINGGAWNSQAWNGIGVSLNPAPDHVILFNQTGIILNWTQVVGTVTWDLEVSLFPDVTNPFLSVNVANSTHTFTDGATNNEKRYWRVRPKDALGNFLEPFSEVASYWLDTSATAQITVNRNNYALGDLSDTTDVYPLDLFPVYSVTPANLWRLKQRNRLGELLSEFLTVKDSISFLFTGENILEHTQMDELQRFNNRLRTFYLIAFKDGIKERPFSHIWKVEFADDPALTMIAAGRPDVLSGTVNFEEV